MNFLRISNAGLVEAEDLYLIGSSTKGGDATKIGMFGSGWKFALAYLVRNNLDIKVFRGKDQISIETKVVLHRNTPVQVLEIDGKETSITTGMGKDWTAWMALREIISNAIDEGDSNVTTIFNPEEFYTEEEQTNIYIQMDKDLRSVMNEYDKYFSYEKEADFMSERGHLFYYKRENTRMNVYRKGIRCFDTRKKTMVDFNFSEIGINESRLTTESTIDNAVRSVIKDERLPLPLLVKLLQSEYSDIIPKQQWNSNIERHCLKLIEAGYDLTTGFVEAVKINPQDIMSVQSDDDNTIFISGKWYSQMMKAGHIESPFEMIEGGGNVPEGARVTNNENVNRIAEILAEFNIHLELKSGAWKDYTKVFTENGIIYIKDGEYKDNLELTTEERYAAAILSVLNSSHYGKAIQMLKDNAKDAASNEQEEKE